ncbi:hypothetical protein CGX12_16565 [Zobellella denitrificans]|uniref:phage major tropism determinant n=1 Tax=Zobellella denitrificans TaxID=347534 RepID=UPI000B8BEA0D|nr:SUMF1/EgtB/PvdO family nonheme iron enzyme [Zobellella denitrificans]OXS13994.1 hypothetical protein CGX12_16565 [Zobellella denitrificans]
MAIYIQPAAAAGFASLLGRIRAGVGDTLDLPEGQINIGGNGKGYLLPPAASWDPLAPINNDGTVSALTLGNNWYIYAVADPSGIARWLASLNATYPDGYHDGNSRKVGGCHIGRIRGVANRYDNAYVPVVGIVPNSCWDLQHRSKADPTGMAEVIPGALWADIYLNSEGPGTWPENIPVSAYGQMPIRDDIYSRSDFHQLARNAGKRLPTVEEWLVLAEGAPQGADGNNDTAWSRTTNTGPTTTGTVAKSVSQLNLVDTVGNLREWIDSHYDYGYSTTGYWLASAVNVGKDAAIPRGQLYSYASGASGTPGWRAWVGGGSWDGGARCGSRCLSSDAYPWHAIGGVGLRCVSDAL